ncbi:MAG: CTQ-dependent lysine 6-oxidase LodA [Pseudomonadota bacterium]
MSDMEQYSIHPAIGIGRVGNSLDSFYLAPEVIGGLPIEADADGNPLFKGDQPLYVSQFKDKTGCVRRQAATFRIYRTVPGQPGQPGQRVAVSLDDPAIEKIVWKVHVANKKAVWWNYVPLLGDLMFGKHNSYQTWTDTPLAWKLTQRSWTSLRNADVTGAQRQQYIVDPGPRELDAPLGKVAFDKASAGDYQHVSFPDPKAITQGLPVRTLGEMRTDAKGNLLVIGAYGRAGGSESITGFGGGDTWNDDIADGPVEATIHFKDGSKPVQLKAWVVIGSPKFAPELVNISTWDDVVADMSIKFKHALPAAYDRAKWSASDGWNTDYVVNFEQDIRPFLERMGDYQWVATVPAMTAFIRPAFDVADASESNRANREQFLSYFRKPSAIEAATPEQPPGFSGGQGNQLFSHATKLEPAAGIPLMPLNSGTNSVRNNIISKFSVLTDTQYFALQQWAAGKFSATAPGLALPGTDPLDRAAIGNCVGEPMCPGIEVTWSVRNPAIYARPYVILHRADADYKKDGLSPDRDECEPIDWRDPTVGAGCEPGDLTKRMAIPWQADFYDCSVQMINFDNPNLVKNPDTMIPVPPTYYAYWWPPQSPWNVISGATGKQEQLAAGVPAGMQVMYSRGMNSFSQMITSWKYLGFVLNQNMDQHYGRQYPYFVEKERNHDKFVVASVGVGNASSFITGDDSNYLPAWFLKDEDPPQIDALNNAVLFAAEGAPAETYHHETPKKIIPAGRRRFSH